MAKRTSRSIDRRCKILKIIKKVGFSAMPTQEELAQKFGVSQRQISKDLQKIREEVPKEDLFLTEVRIEKFFQNSIKELEGLKNSLKDPNAKRNFIMSIATLVEKEINLRQKLGLVEKPVEKVDTTLKIKWEG